MTVSSTSAPAAISENVPNIEAAEATALSDYGSDITIGDLDDEVPPGHAHDSTASDTFDPSQSLPHSIVIARDFAADQHALSHIHSPLSEKHPTRGVLDVSTRPQYSVDIDDIKKSSQTWSTVSSSSNLPCLQEHDNKSTISSAASSILAARGAKIAMYEMDAHQSPLDRFRCKPKKPLSVTDLVSPAWCELQYLYTLSKFGRKPQTQAMRTGSIIHQTLEAEVHNTVPVQVKSKEDRFGLRLWNTIAGLRCLRETGLTRELEVWGIIDGQVVNGVLDELSHECPDSRFEGRVETKALVAGNTLPVPMSGQHNVVSGFTNCKDSSPSERVGANLYPQVYIADVKTRAVPSIPKGAALRPTWMQLMIYRKLVESLSLNIVDAETIFARYGVRPLEPFSQTFVQEIDTLNSNAHGSDFPNLLSLWSLLIYEMQDVLPPAKLSPVLRAEFRLAKSGAVIGSALTSYDPSLIEEYISNMMAWWKGARAARGVDIEDAFKCRICSFAEHCTWRKGKIEEATEKFRLRQQSREKSAV